MLSYHSTPIQEIHDPVLTTAGIRLLVKREDLNHRYVSGNKWWKLKYNLEEAVRRGKDTVVTFGGAYSNHIYATSAAAHACQLKSIGVIRGEEMPPLNPVLAFASQQGMRLHFVSREAYRLKSDPAHLAALKELFGDFYLIPEGGSNELAVQGVAEFATQLDASFDYLCSPVGTGGTLAGLIRGLKGSKEIVGFSVLRGYNALADDVRAFENRYTNWHINSDYHFGGYAKTTRELSEFIADFNKAYGIPIEFVYTGKMFLGIFDLARKGFFKPGGVVLAIHTGGVQQLTN